MADELAVLFLDTNILLHFKSLREIAWKAVANAKAVRLILCSPVLDELDEKRYDPKMKERARSVFAQLKEIEGAEGKVRDGVTLETVTDDEEPDRNHDAAIIRRVLEYRQQQGGLQVAVVSDDFNMRKRCKAKGIKCIELGEAYRLATVQDEYRKKYQEAAQELAAIKKRLPELRVVAAHGAEDSEGEPFEAVLSTSLAPADPDPQVAEIMRKHPKRYAPDTGALKSLQASMAAMMFDSVEIDRYNRDLDAFYAAYRKYVLAVEELKKKHAKCFFFWLWLWNTGGCPASEIQTTVVFPDLFARVLEEDELETEWPQEPSPPDPPGNRLFGMPRFTIPRIDDYLARPLVHDFHSNITKPEIKRGSGFHVTVSVQRLNHKHGCCLGRFSCEFSSWDVVRPFEADYELFARELPELITGKMLFKITKAS